MTLMAKTDMPDTKDERKKYMNRIKNAFREDAKFKPLLLSLLITGLALGLYKGMLDNFLAEVVQMGEMDRGITEFFRELLISFDPNLYGEVADSNMIRTIS